MKAYIAMLQEAQRELSGEPSEENAANARIIIEDILHRIDIDDFEASLNAPSPVIDIEKSWKILREKFFSDCVVKDSIDGLKLRIDYAPHDLFEWFKRELTAQQAPEPEPSKADIIDALIEIFKREGFTGNYKDAAESIYQVMLLDGTIERMKKVAPEPKKNYGNANEIINLLNKER